MNLTIGNLLSRKYIHRDRNVINSDFITKLNEYEVQEDGTLVKFICTSTKTKGEYNVNIFLSTVNIINQNTECKLYCDCKSFQFEFEVALSKINGLLGEPRSTKLPKKQVTGYSCKHIIACILLLLRVNTIDQLGRIK